MSKSRSVTRGKLNSPAGYALHVHPSENYTFIKYELNSSNNGATLIQIYVIKVTFFNLLIYSHNVHICLHNDLLHATVYRSSGECFQHTALDYMVT